VSHAAASSPIDAPIDAVDPAALMAYCATFAERMKLSGTADELASLRMVQAALDGFGYRTALLSHDAYISLPGPAAVEVDGQAVPAITHSFSVASPGLTAPVAYVGQGGAADFAGRDLRGCIVLAEGIASPAVADRALRAGAAGQLHISPHEHLHEMCVSPIWGNPGLSTLAGLPATVVCTVSNRDGSALRDRILQGEAPTVTLRAEVDTGWRPTPILQADLDGPDPGGPFILLSGHHDTWYYGVMDNGSANATMIECARVLAGQHAAWRRGLRLCFWSGHSHGRYSGSAWYVDTHWDELERRCAVHVNVDSTGGVGAVMLAEAAAAAELAPLAAAAIRQETNQEHEGQRNARNSDMSFWGVGVPSMFGALSHQPPAPVAMRNALGWWWHTPHDLLDKIDPAHLARDTRVFVRTLWHLLTDPVLPLDYAAHASALLHELAGIEALLAGALPLDMLVAEAAAVRDKTEALLQPGHDPVRVNRALMQLSRALVPADCTAGDRFTHDPALPQSPWPVLDPVRALAAAAPEQARFAAVDATRARNRLMHALRQAGRALDAALA
jgi:hypothetical protein